VTCPFTQEVAAYVLGALSAAGRLEFERHLEGCDRCTAELRDLAGLPGLLGRVNASVLDGSPVDEPLPATLLPTLTREVRRARRRRTFITAGLAAVLAVIGGSLALWLAGDGPAPTGSGPTASPSAVVVREMDPVGDVPVQASVTLEPVAWGTRLRLTCSYDPEAVEYELPPQARYELVVRTEEGGTEQVGSWISESSQTVQVTAATAEPLGDIESVEVRSADGRVVLRAGA
jgi:hypothetical protein